MAQGSTGHSTEFMTGQLLGPNGKPISSHKKGSPPLLGEAFGSRWTQNNMMWSQLPGGGVVGFDLNKLTLADFRMMRDHYQVNASLSVLSFMMHQLEWRIDCDNKKIKDFCEQNIAEVWTRLVRALSQAFWAGYSPNVLQWENDVNGRAVKLTKIKDLIPEEATVNWKYIDGWAPPDKPVPKLPVYDGINLVGGSYPIPPENTLWYPLLMQNGDHYGRKLLRPAFTSWFFSIIMHLFANRYFERFGEPQLVGRAPYDDELDVNGKKVPGRDVLLGLMNSMRNRSSIVLPAQREASGPNGQHPEYEYTLEYLESQMRGADFERYLMRLDEEISLALFTPLLMLRTADVGSYNLGTTHAQVYMQMLNALSGDWKEYIDRYALDNLVNYNFGPKAPRATMSFRKLGDTRIELIKIILQQLLAGGGVMPDLEQLGEIAGLSLHEIQQVTAPPAKPGDPSADPNADPNADPGAKSNDSNGNSNTGSKGAQASRKVIGQMLERIGPQVTKAYGSGRLADDFVPSLGFERQFTDALIQDGFSRVDAPGVHRFLSAWVGDLAGTDFGSPDAALKLIQNGLEGKVEELCGGKSAKTG